MKISFVSPNISKLPIGFIIFLKINPIKMIAFNCF